MPVVYYDSGRKQETGDGKAFYSVVICHKGGPIYWETRKHVNSHLDKFDLKDTREYLYRYRYTGTHIGIEVLP